MRTSRWIIGRSCVSLDIFVWITFTCSHCHCRSCQEALLLSLHSHYASTSFLTFHSFLLIFSVIAASWTFIYSWKNKPVHQFSLSGNPRFSVNHFSLVLPKTFSAAGPIQCSFLGEQKESKDEEAKVAFSNQAVLTGLGQSVWGTVKGSRRGGSG